MSLSRSRSRERSRGTASAPAGSPALLIALPDDGGVQLLLALSDGAADLLMAEPA